jgi:hypothetical protein
MDTKENRGLHMLIYHSWKDFLEYIHVPANPKGDISFGDNDLAQVLVIPRTI